MKFALGDASKVKWSVLKPHASVIMDDCLFGWADKDELLNDQARWLPPYVTPVVDKDCDAAATINVASKATKLTTADIWAASMNTQWFKLCASLKELLVAKEINIQRIAFAIGSHQPNHGDCNLICLAMFGILILRFRRQETSDNCTQTAALTSFV